MPTPPPSRYVPVGLVQMRCTADAADNLSRAVAGVRAAAAKGARVVCLQELFRSEYFCQTEDHAHFALAEAIPGPSTAALGAVAAELGVVIVASLFERRYARVESVEEKTVRLDFNHPLAGAELHFNVKVVALREPTEEELEHGHVHDGGHHH